MKVIDQNEVFRKYDFSSVISDADNQQAMAIVRDIIGSGNYFHNSPKYQTKENIFSRQEPVWLKYRMSFLMSVFMYLGREVKVHDMMAWSFMTNLATAEDRDTLWHHHHKNGTHMLSGVFYLHIPPDVKDRDYAGTEMAPLGPAHEEKFFVRPADNTWLIYPSKEWHRPGIVQSDQYRFILAADIVVEL